MTKLVQSKSHFYCVTYAYIYLMRWSSKAYQNNQDTSNYLSFSSPLCLRLSHPAFHDRNFRSVVSFRVRVSRHHRRVSPGRIPCQSKHRGNLLLSDAALRRSSRPWPCQWAVLSLSLSHSLFLSSPLVFLRVSPFSGHLSFRRLSFFPRRSLSSFSHSPTNDRMPLVCDVSTVYVLLVARRPETSHSVAPFGHTVLVTPTPDAAAFSLPRRVSPLPVYWACPAFSLALFHVPSSLLARIRPFFPSRSCTSISLPFRCCRRFLGSRCRLLYRLLMPWSVPSCSRRARSRDERLKVWEKPTRRSSASLDFERSR